jgi:hypothetical protein
MHNVGAGWLMTRYRATRERFEANDTIRDREIVLNVCGWVDHAHGFIRARFKRFERSTICCFRYDIASMMLNSTGMKYGTFPPPNFQREQASPTDESALLDRACVLEPWVGLKTPFSRQGGPFARERQVAAR